MKRTGIDARHVFRRYGVVCFLLVFVGQPAMAETPADPDVFARISGEWGARTGHTCEDNPHVVTVSSDRSRITFTYRSPPVAPEKARTMAIEKSSPEVSSDTTIEFQVFDHGKRWIGMRRVGETELDRIGKPRAWKLLFSKDYMSYRWWLYNSVAGKKSWLRGERCQSD